MTDPQRLYKSRFRADERRRKAEVWKVLCRHFFQRYVGRDDTVLDVGASYCEFINNIVCRRKLALDTSVDTRKHADLGVEVVEARSSDLSFLADGTLDVVFVSNFLEDLLDKHEIVLTLSEIHRVLRPGGRCLIFQPNIRYTGGAYWDFFDHHLPLTERSLVEALELVHLHPVEVKPRFLPFTTKSSLPQHPLLVWLYLKLPFVHRILGQQSWIVAVKPRPLRIEWAESATRSPAYVWA